MPHKRRPRVVLDSVVLVSVFLTEEGLAAELFTECVEKTDLCTAEEILQETRRVLLEKDHIRNKYAYHDREVERFIELVREECTVASKLLPRRVIERDPKDDMIIACAVEAKADYIISRDIHLLDLKEYQGIRIVSPEDFVHHLRSNAKP